jgi:hypothetical protein
MAVLGGSSNLTHIVSFEFAADRRVHSRPQIAQRTRANGGVEIYTNPAKIPPQFMLWGPSCGAILFWTREKLGFPKAPPPESQ